MKVLSCFNRLSVIKCVSLHIFLTKNYIKSIFMINPIVKTIELGDGRTIMQFPVQISCLYR